MLIVDYGSLSHYESKAEGGHCSLWRHELMILIDLVQCEVEAGWHTKTLYNNGEFALQRIANTPLLWSVFVWPSSLYPTLHEVNCYKAPNVNSHSLGYFHIMKM